MMETMNDYLKMAKKKGINLQQYAEQLKSSNKSVDLKTSEGRLIQVKSRKLDFLKSTTLNVIRSWDFDLLVIVLFSKDAAACYNRGNAYFKKGDTDRGIYD